MKFFAHAFRDNQGRPVHFEVTFKVSIEAALPHRKETDAEERVVEQAMLLAFLRGFKGVPR